MDNNVNDTTVNDTTVNDTTVNDTTVNDSTGVIALESELQRIIEDLLSPRQPPPPQRSIPINGQFPSPQGSIPTNEYMVFLQSLRDIMVMYNSNISEYNNNVTQSLNMMQQLFRRMNNVNGGERVPEPIYTPTEPAQSPANSQDQVPESRAPSALNNDHLFSYVLYRPTIRSSDATAMRRFFQNIVVRPTPEQIDTGTHLVPYQPNSENTHTSCPITLEEFQEGEMVRQIRHCRHSFQEQALQNWFRANVRCPVCRYDIRDYIVGTSERPDATTEPSPEDPLPLPQENNNNGPGYQSILQQITQNFASDINNILSENFHPNSPSDNSGNLIFEFQVETNL